jgi:polyhydroxyalkanoate synthase subunit PhaC
MSNNSFPIEQYLENLAEYNRQMAERARGASELFHRQIDTRIAATPYTVEYEEDRVRLKHYAPEGGARYNHPLLIVYALINRETMLDLQPDRSVVRNLLANGVELYMIDWGYPTRKDQFLDMDDHINGYIHNAVKHILAKHQLPQLNLMGVCMGGTMCAVYAAQHPQNVKNLLLTVSPTDFATDTGLLHQWWGSKAFNVDRLVDVQGNVSGDMLNLNFLLMNPARLMIDKYHGFMENMDDKQFVENFVRMEKWIFDSPDVPGEIFREFIKDCYQENKLINNKLEVGGQLVELSKISMPVLNIYALYDHLVPPAACENFILKIGSKDAQNYTIETGHIGIYVSARSQKAFVPKICSWLKTRDAKPVKKKKTRSAKSQQFKRRSAQAAQETTEKTSAAIRKAARG